MRISDWSSDVCSSDLKADQQSEVEPDQRQADGIEDAENDADGALTAHKAGNGRVHVAGKPAHRRRLVARDTAIDLVHHLVPVEQDVEGDHRGDDQRSEEHTSELKSLMRISYAVFRL